LFSDKRDADRDLAGKMGKKEPTGTEGKRNSRPFSDSGKESFPG
jgi:hypothetical protein